MSDVRKASRQCRGKARYDSEYDANARRIEHHGHAPSLNVYLCPHCHFWHVGHTIREDA